MKTELSSKILHSGVTSGPRKQDVTSSNHTSDRGDNIEIKKVDVPQSTQTENAGSDANSVKKSQDKTDIREAIGKLDELVKSTRRDLQFSVDDESGETVVKIVDRQTKEVVRQIPSEEVLAAMKNMDALKGLLFAKKV